MKVSLLLLFLQLLGNVDLSLSQNACSKLPDVPHANVTEETRKAEYQEGDVIHFACGPGYISDHTSKYVCTHQGWLALRRGMCYSCSKLPDVPHANVTEETRKAEYQEGDVIHFACEPGYASDLTIKYICASEGWLAIRQGLCYIIACEVGIMHPALTATGLPSASETVQFGHKLQFDCSSDFQLDGSKEIECLETGQWSSPFPTCSEKCKVPRLSANIQVTQGLSGRYVTEGQTLTFGCQRHEHVIRGNPTVECLAGGEWSSPFPTCGAPWLCMRPPPLENGDTKESIQFMYRHNTRVEYVCQNFYVMEGEPYMTCNNSEWTGRMRCLKPCTVDKDAMTRHNIRFRHRYDDKLYASHNDVISFSCTYGTSHVGTLEMRQKCIDGVIDLPTCQ